MEKEKCVEMAWKCQKNAEEEDGKRGYQSNVKGTNRGGRLPKRQSGRRKTGSRECKKSMLREGNVETVL